MTKFFWQPRFRTNVRDLPTIIRHKREDSFKWKKFNTKGPTLKLKENPPKSVISEKSFTKVPFFAGLLPITIHHLFSPSSLLKTHVDHEDRQGPSLLALLNGPVDPRGDSNIFWAGPHGSNYVYKVGCVWNLRRNLRVKLAFLYKFWEVIFKQWDMWNEWCVF